MKNSTKYTLTAFTLLMAGASFQAAALDNTVSVPEEARVGSHADYAGSAEYTFAKPAPTVTIVGEFTTGTIGESAYDYTGYLEVRNATSVTPLTNVCLTKLTDTSEANTVLSTNIVADIETAAGTESSATIADGSSIAACYNGGTLKLNNIKVPFSAVEYGKHTVTMGVTAYWK